MNNSITAYFEADHQRLDSLYLAFKQHLSEQKNELAKSYFLAFKQGIEQHIVWEETVLFPFFERQTGMINGPTRVMTAEHQQVFQLNDAILACLEQQTASESFQNELEKLLQAHNHKEENILYPMLDNNSDEHQKATMFFDIFNITK